MTDRGTVYLPIRRAGRARFRGWHDPVDVIQAATLADVGRALDTLMHGLNRGLQAAGWIAYEAAPAMDAALTVAPTCPVPLLWFGLYRRADDVAVVDLERSATPFRLGAWTPSISEDRYLADVERIRGCLARGETYQVNHTFRLRTAFEGDPLALFLRLYRAQPSACAMYIDAGDTVLASASPEMFIRRHGSLLTARPMKGTATRGTNPAADALQAQRLQTSPKDRAENVMIVDMIRNDMGRVAVPGSVRVRRLFAMERYPTVFQMTSTVTGRTTADLSAVLRAMFPCASITGAPKVRTMALIRELETTPRGVYTGCMGYFSSPTAFHFNVAIRTVTIDRPAKSAEYGVGGGIVWDSHGPREYRECLAKAAVLRSLTADGAADRLTADFP